MDDNLARHNATGRDEPRPDATGPDHDYSLTIEQAADRYATAGHPRTIRTLQRYCASGHLDCQKIATTFGDKYLVAPYSVTRHIGQINEVIAFTERTTGRDEPRPDATHVVLQQSHEKESSPPATSPDMSRQDATGNREVKEGDSRYIGQLETRIEEKDEVIGLLNMVLALEAPGATRMTRDVPVAEQGNQEAQS
jgi:hypothetical protein